MLIVHKNVSFRIKNNIVFTCVYIHVKAGSFSCQYSDSDYMSAILDGLVNTITATVPIVVTNR